jgi:hypothetical protein
MYTMPSFKTKKALKAALASGITIRAYSPGIFPCPQNGVITIEGPEYPQPHTWYAEATVENGVIVKVK